jgi:acyl-[acyl carrier protein]--UDP-N-acetylglucosamine O-acyltransferase
MYRRVINNMNSINNKFYNINIKRLFAFTIGKNNIISKSCIIHENVSIGNDNFIGDNVIIYPNTVIGDNNNIFPGNIIGEVPVSSNENFIKYNLNKCKGVIIGNNNLLHVNNLIFSGIDNKTFIGEHNKLLAENHISHDAYITTNVTLYPRVICGGYVIFLDYSNVGMDAVIHQRKVVGHYSMIGANNMVSKNVFPYFININGKLNRLNEMKIPHYVKEHEHVLREINENFKNKNYDIDKYNLPSEMMNSLKKYLKYI